ncbi:aminoacyl-tRNA hydrolase, partial [candidate division KSB1 bacterium]
MKLIIGLGNPEERYKFTKHNIGFVVLDRISEKLKSSFKVGKGDYLIAEVDCERDKVLLIKPLTYMNNSGVAVKDAVDRYDVLIEDLLVICDDLNLSLGKIRFRRGGGDGGNNGLASIIYHLETIEFSRLRIGIKDGELGDDFSRFVLSKFKKGKENIVKDIIDFAADC